MDGETAFRLLVTGVLVVAPTLLFLGLWRGLMALCDDDLAARTARGEFGPMPDSPLPTRLPGTVSVERLQVAASSEERSDREPSATRDGERESRAASAGGPSSTPTDASGVDIVHCPHCETPNPRYGDYCANCLAALD